MTIKKDDTASFVIRFTQKIYEGESGEAEVQWRGHISHVQGGDEKRFVDFNKAMDFIQGKLSDLTINATDDKTPEQQEGILTKSFNIWKKVASSAPQMVMETIKDPKKQVEQLRNDITQVGDAIGQKIEHEMDTWRGPSKTDFKLMMNRLEALTEEMSSLHQKVDGLNRKSK